jgi:26S proteasome regulatory subunit (ATPase 3-interacting protein)
LQQSNRPFSANDIQTNLNGQIGKTAVVNSLEELANEKKINEKVYGKQKVYMALQVI